MTNENKIAATDDAILRDAVLAGDTGARKHLNTVVAPFIEFLVNRFCKKYCKENRRRYRCTAPQPWPDDDARKLLCEWGNGSYAWMLHELTRDERLRRYEGRNGATLRSYLYVVANSRAFYERWKDWRFGRREHVPDYIKSLHPQASALFFALRAHTDAAAIAPALGLSHTETTELSRRIVLELTQRGRLYLLERPRGVTLDDALESDHHAMTEDNHLSDGLDRDRIRDAWRRLEPLEQFVLDAMVVDDQDANAILAAIKDTDLSATALNVQQLYYLKRKSLAKLAKLAGISP